MLRNRPVAVALSLAVAALCTLLFAGPAPAEDLESKLEAKQSKLDEVRETQGRADDDDLPLRRPDRPPDRRGRGDPQPRGSGPRPARRQAGRARPGGRRARRRQGPAGGAARAPASAPWSPCASGWSRCTRPAPRTCSASSSAPAASTTSPPAPNTSTACTAWTRRSSAACATCATRCSGWSTACAAPRTGSKPPATRSPPKSRRWPSARAALQSHQQAAGLAPAAERDRGAGADQRPRGGARRRRRRDPGQDRRAALRDRLDAAAGGPDPGRQRRPDLAGQRRRRLRLRRRAGGYDARGDRHRRAGKDADPRRRLGHRRPHRSRRPRSGGYGNFTCIDHGGGLSTCYAHQTSFAVSAGQSVSQGDIIGYTGCTGYCLGPHLHFEVRINGSVTDPMGYL